jgi:hypothetical protein
MMVKPQHIKEIDKQLRIHNSKVDEQFIDNQEHALFNILYLACSQRNYGVKHDMIANIKTSEFSLENICENKF